MEKPDVDLIEGLSPAIAIEQKATSHNPRSTVGTVTEIHDYLRLLFARVGDPYCPEHGMTLAGADRVADGGPCAATARGHALMILSPLVVDRKGEQLDLFDELRAQGFVRLRIDGKVYEIDAVPKLCQEHQAHRRGRRRPAEGQRRMPSSAWPNRSRPRCAMPTAARIAVEMDTGKEHLFSAKFACPICNYSLPELEPRLFSFNNPMGACPRMRRPGRDQFLRSASAWWPSRSCRLARARSRAGTGATSSIFQMLHEPRAALSASTSDKPFESCRERVQEIVLYGSGKEKIAFTVSERTRQADGCASMLSRASSRTWSGATAKPIRVTVREELAKYLNNKPCPECEGTRLRSEARHVRSARQAPIFESQRAAAQGGAALFPGPEAARPQGGRSPKGSSRRSPPRLTFLNNVGLDYLSLDRSADTLSGGEAQRIRLASQIGSGLTGVMYVLDEPSIGLHQRDNDRLLGDAQAPARPRQHA